MQSCLRLNNRGCRTGRAKRRKALTSPTICERLAARLEKKNQEFLERSITPLPRGFGAVCVVGSDVYDKLQVLRALRPRISNAIFLTTGLDARLFHSDETRVTRNLIVASSFGLQLAKKYQGEIPSFRDSYQTAVFASTLCALGHMGPDQIQNGAPRIYEIGRTGPVDLTVVKNPGGWKEDIHEDFFKNQQFEQTCSR